MNYGFYAYGKLYNSQITDEDHNQSADYTAIIYFSMLQSG